MPRTGSPRWPASIIGSTRATGSPPSLPIIGRERELSLLHACLTRVQAGHGQVVGIVSLGAPVKRTVQTAAVIGHECGLQLLTRLSAPTVEVRDALETLLHRAEQVYFGGYFCKITSPVE